MIKGRAGPMAMRKRCLLGQEMCRIYANSRKEEPLTTVMTSIYVFTVI
jgi:hypothetical protein